MGEVLATCLGGSVNVVARVVERLVEADVSLDVARLETAARHFLREEAPLASEHAVQAVVDSIVGLGPLEELLRDPTVSDVLVNGSGDIWVERAGRLEVADVRFLSPEAVVAAVERVIAPLGLRLDRSSPTVDARLPDGSRLHASIPPVSIDGPVLAIRRFTQAVADLDGLRREGSISEDGAAVLRTAVQERHNILISGGTGAGKTTLLNILSTEIPPSQRVVTIEDAAELSLTGHVVRLEARPANAEGAGEVTLRDLVRAALRLRPDRIIVGEVRGPEALDMISAMNTGHHGSMSTVHANSPEEALWRLETLALSGSSRVSEKAVRRQMRSAIHLIIQIERAKTGRRITSVSRIEDDSITELL